MIKNIIFFALLILGVALLLVFVRSQKEESEFALFWPGTEVACLPSGHQNLAQHIHPAMMVTVNGMTEVIPANVGYSGDCMAELHTHDADGVIHIETVTPTRSFTARDFFTVWARPYDRDGFTRTLRVNGEVVQDDYLLKDLDEVSVEYLSVD